MNASHGTLISFVELLISQFLEKSSGNQMSSFMRCESATHTDMKCSLLQNQTQTGSKGDTFIHFVQIKVCQKSVSWPERSIFWIKLDSHCKINTFGMLNLWKSQWNEGHNSFSHSWIWNTFYLQWNVNRTAEGSC